ncbi:MAG: hypothetical protein AABZ06_06710 [Bdellovibrionota bacterium]
MRREYLLKIEVNGRQFNRVVIDSHYQVKHLKSITDPLILELVKSLNGSESLPEKVLPSGFEIYVDDPVFLGEKPYRLIWTAHPKENYIGIINAFRRAVWRK